MLFILAAPSYITGNCFSSSAGHYCSLIPLHGAGLLPPGSDGGGTGLALPSASQLTGDDVSVCRLEFSQVLSY